VDECRRAALALQTCIANDIKPRDVMTMKAFENAVRLVMVAALPRPTTPIPHPGLNEPDP
jgi:dihydroxyacid dehydratase/phosphogluconate dehydratase